MLKAPWAALLLALGAASASPQDAGEAPDSSAAADTAAAPDTAAALVERQQGRIIYPDGREAFIEPDTLPFGQGEVLEYDIQYGFVRVGRARLETERVEEYRGRAALRILSRARSLKWVDGVYKVRDEVSSLLDLERMQSLYFAKQLREGKYKADLKADYLHEEGVARYADGSERDLVPGSQDPLAALFVVRTFPLEPGMRLSIPLHDGKKNYPLEVEVVGRETVDTALGKIACLVLEPRMKSGGLFKSEGRMQVYISDDARRIPVLLRAKAPVGAFTSTVSSHQPGEPLPALGSPP